MGMCTSKQKSRIMVKSNFFVNGDTISDIGEYLYFSEGSKCSHSSLASQEIIKNINVDPENDQQKNTEEIYLKQDIIRDNQQQNFEEIYHKQNVVTLEKTKNTEIYGSVDDNLLSDISLSPEDCETPSPQNVNIMISDEQSYVAMRPELQIIKKTKVRALHHYRPNDSRDLQFRKGDFLMVSSDLRDSWWYAEHVKTLESGYIPCNYVVVDDGSPKSLDGFFDICRNEADKKLLLPGYVEGTYIIRPSTRKQNFALSIRFFDNEKQFFVVKHYRIRQLMNGHYCIVHENQFADVKNLIRHYHCHLNGLCCRLKEPFPKTIRPVIQFRDIEVNRNCIECTEKIGSGHFGEVWLATWNKTVNVAVKKLKRNASDEVYRKSFLEEAKLMHKLHHPKIVEILGICSEPEDQPVLIIIEHMSKGSLLEVLKAGNEETIHFNDMLYMWTQIADGMAYLESENFIHRDLRTANILVGDDYLVKVSDFGLARVIEGTYLTSGNTIPVRWTAPEAGLHKIFSIKSDVWSFGVLMYEIVTFGQTPYQDLEVNEVLLATEQGVRLPRPTGDKFDCPLQIYDIMKTCWDAVPEKRPTFIHLKDVFENYNIFSERSYDENEFKKRNRFF